MSRGRETMTARRAAELLSVLESQVSRPRLIPRPTYEAARKKSAFGVCSWCGSASVVWVSLPSGARAPVERKEDGDLAVVKGVAVAYGELHAGQARWALHFQTCPRRRANAIQ